MQKPAANKAENNTLRVFMTPPSRGKYCVFWVRGTARISLAYVRSLSGTHPDLQACRQNPGFPGKARKRLRSIRARYMIRTMVQILNPGSNKVTSERMRRKSEARRLDILRAAARVFRRSGVAAAGMRDIAAEADLSPGNLYYYFAGKDELLFFCQDRTVDRMLEAAETARASTVPVADQLRAVIRAHLHYTLDELEGPAPDHHRKARQIRARGARAHRQRYQARRIHALRRRARCARHSRSA
jgi:AcrR family transcriptional regulator